MRPWVLLLLVATVAGEETLLERRLASVDRAYVRRLLGLGRKAERKKCERFAAEVFDRVLAIDPDNREARRKRFFEKKDGKWQRTPLDKAKANALFDLDRLIIADFRGELADHVHWRVEATIRVCREHATPAERKRVLEGLLYDASDSHTLRVALRHKRIHGVWVHPELVATVKGMRRRLQEWRTCRCRSPTTLV